MTDLLIKFFHLDISQRCKRVEPVAWQLVHSLAPVCNSPRPIFPSEAGLAIGVNPADARPS